MSGTYQAVFTPPPLPPTPTAATAAAAAGGLKLEEAGTAGTLKAEGTKGEAMKAEGGVGVVKAEPVDGAATGSVSVKEEEREAPLKKPSARERCACLLFLPAAFTPPSPSLSLHIIHRLLVRGVLA